MRKPSFAIAGAGLGGLTAAIALQRAGYECKVYEQAPAIGRVGAGINIAPNSTRMFEAIGLGDKLRRVGIEPKCKLSRHFETTDVMFSVPVAELTEIYGAPFLAFHRAELHAVLASALTPGTVEVGKRLLRVSDDGASMHLSFEDGSSALADAVVGADGVHSKVRDYITDEDILSYHGLAAYRAIVQRHAVDAPLDDNTKWWAPDRYVMVYFLSEKRDQVHFVASTPEPLGPSFAPSEAKLEVLYEAFAAFHPNVMALLRAATDVTRWPLIEGRTFSPWFKHKAVLLGDACHATTPHMGQGAGMAFEDAFVLARCVQESEQNLERAFAIYEKNRRERTARIQFESHENRWTKSSMDHKWVYGYDAMTVSLQDPAS
jgi:6-hydroxynicotinate 3-monooxygenase